MTRTFIAAILVLACQSPATGAGAPEAAAGQPQPSRPGFSPNRQEEDWSFLADEALRVDSFDALKRIPIKGFEPAYVYLGGSFRTQLKQFRNENFGDFAGSDTASYRRLMLQGGLVFGDGARLFVEIKRGRVEGRRFPLPPPEQEAGDFNQGFIELRGAAPIAGETALLLARVGRQELNYGAGRLVSVREGVNSRRSHDGVLVRYSGPKWQADALIGVPSEDNPGAFDNGPVDGERFSALYATRQLAAGQAVDLYYLGDRRPIVRYANAAGRENRHTVGVRFAARTAVLTVDAEAAYQFGHLHDVSGPLSIRAWTMAGAFEFMASPQVAGTTFGASFGIASGDRSAADGRIETFRAPAAPGRYFGKASPLGPSNVAGFGLLTKLRPTPQVTVSAELRSFWRVERSDGLYNPPGGLVRPAHAGARYVGSEPLVAVEYRFDRHLSLSATAAHFKVGSSFRDTARARDIGYAELQLAFIF